MNQFLETPIDPRTLPHLTLRRLAFGALFPGLMLLAVSPAAGQKGAAPPVDGRMACADGVITGIDIDRGTVFDPDSTDIPFVGWTYKAMNLLHVRTRQSFVRRELLFREGDCYDDFLRSESERLLESYVFLDEARITASTDDAGGRKVQVQTWDRWSTQVDVGVTYDDGLNVEKFQVVEENFLGQGVYAEFTRRQRRELQAQSFGLRTPRFFGRSDAGIEYGRDRPGTFFSEYLRYPFVGETGRFSLRQGYVNGTRFFAYATADTEEYSQVVVPAFAEEVEVSGALRLGDPGRSVIAGLTLTRGVIRFPRGAEVIYQDDFDDIQPFPGTPPARVLEQLRASSATRVLLHVGARRLRYERYEGIDGLRDRLLVPLGFDGSLAVGKGFGAFRPMDVPADDAFFGRAHLLYTVPVGSSLLQLGGTAESRRDAGAWRDVLADADIVAYLRNDAFSSHTLFVRGSFGGGWNTTLPFQLSLGGRLGVRSIAEDRFPGGRSALFVIEDRVVFPWVQRSMALGMTTFVDVGRVWPGDAPYGVDSDWQATLGLGLRIGVPARSRRIWRTDIAFPVGSAGGSPIFRVTLEFNRLGTGFFTQDVARSRRFNVGTESF